MTWQERFEEILEKLKKEGWGLGPNQERYLRTFISQVEKEAEERVRFDIKSKLWDFFIKDQVSAVYELDDIVYGFNHVFHLSDNNKQA